MKKYYYNDFTKFNKPSRIVNLDFSFYLINNNVVTEVSPFGSISINNYNEPFINVNNYYFNIYENMPIEKFVEATDGTNFVFKINDNNELITIQYDDALDINVEKIYDEELDRVYLNDSDFYYKGYVAYKKSNDNKVYIIQFDNIQKRKEKRFIKTAINESFNNILIVSTIFNKGIIDLNNYIYTDYLNLNKEDIKYLIFLIYNKNQRLFYNFYNFEQISKYYKKYYSFQFPAQNVNLDLAYKNDINNISYEVIQIITESIDAFKGY